ncbi:HU family DNA-binding protein [Prevotella nigrescens]|jgi:putative DNA-binding protein|uniref:HU family DNA-binding protein n=1 Tax=Prevotella nigrescens TaxID=28133 RepID=UPI00021845E3|nr:HU family DNA-binding protein [Prevotella nigrescens]EGQ16884.1 DNA-binding protein histone family protein [Prevotella nigrescens ATCC 33563]MBF1445705.1 HU family DNA-binding protein [Prevotella nigrescens]OWP30442.1 DNA-binding protein [Prevotella nigrescens]UAK27766.1 HU family DNA-binding protein [Prevotella nigrescens]WMS21490.1 HU family DNA-binding protein [Prevotella nigrescens]
MIVFEVKSRKQPIGKRKGQTVYFASASSQQHLTNKNVVAQIVRETSLSEGDISNALISLATVVREALRSGLSVDLADLGSFRLIVPASMVDSEDEVTTETLKTPKIIFTPKRAMRDAAKSVELRIMKKKRKVSKRDKGEEGL